MIRREAENQLARLNRLQNEQSTLVEAFNRAAEGEYSSEFMAGVLEDVLIPGGDVSTPAAEYQKNFAEKMVALSIIYLKAIQLTIERAILVGCKGSQVENPNGTRLFKKELIESHDRRVEKYGLSDLRIHNRVARGLVTLAGVYSQVATSLDPYTAQAENVLGISTDSLDATLKDYSKLEASLNLLEKGYDTFDINFQNKQLPQDSRKVTASFIRNSYELGNLQMKIIENVISQIGSSIGFLYAIHNRAEPKLSKAEQQARTTITSNMASRQPGMELPYIFARNYYKEVIDLSA